MNQLKQSVVYIISSYGRVVSAILETKRNGKHAQYSLVRLRGDRFDGSKSHFSRSGPLLRFAQSDDKILGIDPGGTIPDTRAVAVSSLQHVS